jgi:hypothetical protein
MARNLTSRTKCLQAFQRYARLLRANDYGYVSCISCTSTMMPWNQCDGGHYISRMNRPTELEIDNVWPQCKQCNCERQGNPLFYRANLIGKIGIERVERLENMVLAKENPDLLPKLSKADKENVTHKKTDAEYEKLYRFYNAECTRLIKEKGLKVSY